MLARSWRPVNNVVISGCGMSEISCSVSFFGKETRCKFTRSSIMYSVEDSENLRLGNELVDINR
ncbi:hypothetical protein HanIR_Chr14g0678711 [Helianthus annuus]|nr:hypothetical protein HanIR_Chr14g0678711 [Helianthus annuus]